MKILKEGDICTCLVSEEMNVYKIISISLRDSEVLKISNNKSYKHYNGLYFKDPGVWRLSTEEEIAKALAEKLKG